MDSSNRQWKLAHRPHRQVRQRDFVATSSPLRSPEDGEILVRNLWLSCAPQMREWMDDAPQASGPPLGIGDVVRCPAVAQVVESRSEHYAAGELVKGLFGWQQYAVVGAQARWGDDGALAREWTGLPRVQRVPTGVQPRLALSVLGTNGLAAYVGLLKIARPRPGQCVVVTSAAGATGSLAGQIARTLGCRVVGIAGSAAKCDLLVRQLGFDVAIDRHSDELVEQLHAACPDGIDVVFDTAQGAVLDACLSNLAKHAQVLMCGAIATVASGTAQPVLGLMNAIWKRASLRGFSAYEFLDKETEALTTLARWVESGEIKVLEDVRRGFDAIPLAFIDMLAGASVGKRLVHLADPTTR